MTFKNTIRTGKQVAFPAAVWVCLIYLLAPSATAQQAPMPVFAPGAGEIRITSDQMVMHTGGNQAEFTGDVHAVQGETSMRSKRLKVFYKSNSGSGVQNEGVKKDSIKKIEASGDVIIDFRQTTARAQKAVYTAEDGVLKLNGSPASLENSESVITGTQIIMHRDTGDLEVKGDSDQQVEAVIKTDIK